MSLKEKTSTLLTNSLPYDGRSNAPKIFRRVDFPLPDGPTMDMNSPFLTLKLIFLSATNLPALESNTLDMFVALRANDSTFLLFSPSVYSIDFCQIRYIRCTL